MVEATHRMSKAECLAKAGECYELANAAMDKRHRIMLKHIAETWERIAETAD